MKIRAHFDGKVIVPDEPLDLRPDQALIVHLETLKAEPGESALTVPIWEGSSPRL
jgi:hypothetical protein